MILQHQRHHPRTPIEFWNIDTQFGRDSCYINHPANLLTIQLTDTSKVIPNCNNEKNCTTVSSLITVYITA